MSITELAEHQKTKRILDPGDPLPSAEEFLNDRYVTAGLWTLVNWQGEYYAWDGAAYRAADRQAVRAQMYRFLSASHRWDSENERAVPFRPTQSKVSNAMDALDAAANLPANVEPPAWLSGAPIDMPEPRNLLSCANGILHLPTLESYSPTPHLFTLNGLEFDYDPDAPEPEEWQRFLESIWPDDPESIATLQEIFGYLLTPDTSQQKLFLMVGPKRSGKGTISRVLQALLGKANVAAPTLDALGQNFGLAPLIGKTAAIIADARLGGRTDQQAIAERLLSISGEDSLTIDRKYKPAWTGQLATRFLIQTNELPRIADASGALASRFVILQMERSFYGQEDPGLTHRLLGELPGILNWAIDGWVRLQERGHFFQPQSGQEALDELEALGSPILTFVSDRCVTGPEYETAISTLYSAWKDWCSEHGRDFHGTQQSFGRDLRTAVPGLKASQPRDINGKRYRAYTGIGLASNP